MGYNEVFDIRIYLYELRMISTQGLKCNYSHYHEIYDF